MVPHQFILEVNGDLVGYRAQMTGPQKDVVSNYKSKDLFSLFFGAM